MNKPFSEGYVLRTTAKHMRKAVEISIRKTFERIADFDGDIDKSREVFNTLTKLHALKKQVEEIQLTYKDENAGA